MNQETPPWLGYSLLGILIITILIGIAVTSGTFGGPSDLDAFKAHVEGGGR